MKIFPQKIREINRSPSNNINFLSLTLIFTVLAVMTAALLFWSPAAAQNYRDLEGDEINISTLEEGEYLVKVRGNALFTSEELEITGEEADYNSLQQELEFRGEVEANAPDFYVSSQNLLYLVEQEKAEFTGDPYVEFQNFTANADMVEYFLAEDRAMLTGDVEGTRNGNDFTANEVKIDMEKETVDLRGDARIRILDEEGELIDAEDEGE